MDYCTEHPLARVITVLLQTIDLPTEPVEIAYVRSMRYALSDKLDPKNYTDLHSEFNHYRHSKLVEPKSLQVLPTGLNTYGMLIDRLTILFIRSTITRCADHIQINDMLSAIDDCKPGSSSTFNKITTIVERSGEIDAFHSLVDLLTTNLLLWLAQDVLYLRGPESLPDQELRAYIVFFAEQNVYRNHLISSSERLFWNENISLHS